MISIDCESPKYEHTSYIEKRNAALAKAGEYGETASVARSSLVVLLYSASSALRFGKDCSVCRKAWRHFLMVLIADTATLFVPFMPFVVIASNEYRSCGFLSSVPTSRSLRSEIEAIDDSILRAVSLSASVLEEGNEIDCRPASGIIKWIVCLSSYPKHTLPDFVQCWQTGRARSHWIFRSLHVLHPLLGWPGLTIMEGWF